MQFPIYHVVSSGKGKRRGRMEIAVLVVRNVGGQATMKSVNRHVHQVGYEWIGKHPDFYDGVDAKNGRAEEMFASLDSELASLTKKLEQLDEEISSWVEQKKFEEKAESIAKGLKDKLDMERATKNSVISLLGPMRPFFVKKLKEKIAATRADAINVGVKKEHAERYLADVRRDFPRMVAYVGDGTI